MTQLPADRESLQVLLARIHERLNEAGSVDTGSRELLTQVMGDIERALAAQGAPAVAAEATEANTSRLEALAVRFEADIDLSSGASRCNCTLCTKRSGAGIIVKPSAFRLLTDERALAGYAWGGKTGTFYFCPKCGIHVFGREPPWQTRERRHP